MKAINFNRSRAGVVSLAVLAAFSSVGVQAADPVCAISRDVSGVQGRNPAAGSAVTCLVESKVGAMATAQDVASIQGRGHAVLDRLAPAATNVVARDLKSAPVQHVLGRSNQDVSAQLRKQEAAIAESLSN